MKLAVHQYTQLSVAVKVMNHAKIRTQNMSGKVMREIHHLEACCGHPHVMRMFEMVNTPTDMFVVCEFVKGGELFEYIVERGHLPPPEALRLFRQLISGVAFIHSKRVCHRDLKV